MKFSASELVKRSASQLLYKELKKLKWKTTPGQIKGDTYAEEIVKKEEGSAEKRGIIKLQDDDLLFFCISWKIFISCASIPRVASNIRIHTSEFSIERMLRITL